MGRSSTRGLRSARGAAFAKHRRQVSSQSALGPSRVAAALLGIFLGTFGVHKFYLGKIAQGVLYLIFFWTFIPSIVGFIEGIWYLTMSDVEFQARFPQRP